VEFWSLERIQRECGRDGVKEYLPENVAGSRAHGRITDDTQMTLFTVEGMIRASVRQDRGLGFTVGVLHHAYDRWLDTQLQSGPDGERWVAHQRTLALLAQSTRQHVPLNHLEVPRGGRRKLEQFGEAATNMSKGCGGVMRSAPFGLVPPWVWPSDWQFDTAAEAAAYTHGHSTGQMASGALAVLIGSVMRGHDLPRAIDETQSQLRARHGYAEVYQAINQATEVARMGPGPEHIESLGGGWVAEEALAMAIYASLVCQALQGVPVIELASAPAPSTVQRVRRRRAASSKTMINPATSVPSAAAMVTNGSPRKMPCRVQHQLPTKPIHRLSWDTSEALHSDQVLNDWST